MSENQEVWSIEPSKLKEFIKAEYKGRKRSILVKGAIGIGKSSVVLQTAKELAKELKLKFVHLNKISDYEAIQLLKNLDDKFLFWSVPLPSIDVVDFLGRLEKMDGYVVWMPPIKIVLLQKAKHGMVFLDELNMVENQDVRHLAQRLLLDKEIGGIINENLLIVSACNRAIDTEHVSELGSRGKSRVVILEMEPFTIEQFARYMRALYGSKFDYTVVAFLFATSKDGKHSPYFVTLDENEEELENFANPRNWESLGVVSYDARHLDIERQLARGCLGKEIAIKYLAFKKLKPIPPKELILKPEMINTVKPEIQLYSVITLADSINREAISLNEAMNFMRYLAKNNRSLLMMLWMALDRKYTQEIIREFTFDKEVWSEIEKMVKYL